MPTAIALIRGINVGGNNRLPMETLRSLAADIGLRDTRTYIQSGNLIFNAPPRDIASAARRLQHAIHARLGFSPRIVVRTLDQLRTVLAANPFEGRGIKGDRLLVMFLEAAPTPSCRDAVPALRCEPDEVRLIGHEVFMHLPHGVAEATLPMSALEKALGVPGTTRNWNTLLKLIAMGEAMLESSSAPAASPPSGSRTQQANPRAPKTARGPQASKSSKPAKRRPR